MSAYNRSRLISAINKFNKQEYFECHEILEDIWFDVHDNTKDLYRGLLHFATALYHLNKKNIRGTLLQLEKAIERLKDYNNFVNGIDVPKVIKQILSLKKRLNKKVFPKKYPKINIT
ncbi:MAG: DUF309 domain-containing protein [Ignavibacteria bacterium]|nr:DUF309 domain-containing protein [Ignavibacteria bacterium]